MRIPKEERKAFIPCPEGPTSAVCVDVVDKGWVESGFKDEKTGEAKRQHKMELVWQTARRMDDGRPFIVSSTYNAVISSATGKESNLYKLLMAWGIAPEKLLEGDEYNFDLLLGEPCLLNVAHKKGDKVTFVNVASIMPLPEGMPAMAPEGYVRRQDRDIPAESRAALDDEPIPYEDADDPGF